MTEEEMKLNAEELLKKDEWYTILSNKNTNMYTGKGKPVIAQYNENETCVILVSEKEFAKEIASKYRVEKIDGENLVGKLKGKDTLAKFLSAAVSQSVKYVDYNSGKEDGFGAEIEYLMKLLGLEKVEATEFDEVIVEDFSNPYKISNERAGEILNHIFITSQDELVDAIENKENLAENCFVYNYIQTNLIKQAKENGSEEDSKYFENLEELLIKEIKRKLLEKPFYIFKSKENGEVVIKNESMYLLYTNRFKSISNYGYQEVHGRDGLLGLLNKYSILKFLITDGFNSAVTIDASKILL